MRLFHVKTSSQKHGKHFTRVTEVSKVVGLPSAKDVPIPQSLPIFFPYNSLKLGCQGNGNNNVSTPTTHTSLFASKLQLFTYLLCAYGNEMVNKRWKRKEKLR